MSITLTRMMITSSEYIRSFNFNVTKLKRDELRTTNTTAGDARVNGEISDTIPHSYTNAVFPENVSPARFPRGRLQREGEGSSKIFLKHFPRVDRAADDDDGGGDDEHARKRRCAGAQRG